MEVDGTEEEEVTCPKCKHKFVWTFSYSTDVDLSDMAQDNSWRD